MQRRPTPRHFSLSVLALAVAAGAAAPLPALAQGDRATGLEEIVVTAQRREESLQDTPISITAFTEDKLGELGVFDVSQVADFAPNVTIQRQPSSNSNMGVNIRGVGMGETSLLADPKVGFYMDGVFMSKTIGGVFDVVDLERVEVLRGPQGTLFGRNTTGGAINVTTKKPTGELGVKAEGSYGSDSYQRYGLSVDLPAFANIATKISVNHMQTDGWATNNYEGPATAPLASTDDSEAKLASEDNWAGRIALRWTPVESVTVDYAYDNTTNDGVPAPFQIVAVKNSLYNGFTDTPTPFTFIGGALYQQMAGSVGDPDERQDSFMLDGVSEEWLDVEGHTLQVAWEASEDLTFKYIGGIRHTDSGYDSTDLDGGALMARDLFYGSFLGNNGAIPIPGFHAAIKKGKIETETHEVQVIGNFFDNRLFYTGGLFYYNEDVFQDNPQTFALPIEFILANPAAAAALRPLYNAFGYCPPEFGGFVCTGTQRLPFADGVGDPAAVDFRYGQESESWAAYGQATFEVTEQFALTGGLRYTEDDKDAFLFNQNLDIDGNPANGTQAGEVSADESWDNISYMVNGNYKFTDDLSVYLKFSTGYNGGGFNARASTLQSFTTPFEEEEVEVWELGMKSEFWDNRVRFNAALFSNDYTDIQIAQFEAGSGGASSKIVNAGQGTYEGFELELMVMPVDGLLLEANYGYLDASFDEYLALNPATNQLEDISDATTVAQAPENSWNVGVQYDFEPMSFGELTFRVDAAYKDEFVFHPFNNQYDSADDRTLVNARLTLSQIPLVNDCNHLKVSLWGKNLTDEEYRNWGIDFGSLGFAGDVYGDPLSYGVDVTYTYD